MLGNGGKCNCTISHCINRKRTRGFYIPKLVIGIDAVNQGNWSMSVKLRLECFAIDE